MKRRSFLKNSAAMTAALALSPDIFARRERNRGSAFKHFVFINLNGAPSHLEMFDPKPNHKNGGPTEAIATKTEGLMFASHFERLAERSDKMAVMRMTSTDNNHGTAQDFLNFGAVRANGASLNRPTMSAIAAHTLAKGLDSGLPSHVSMGGRQGTGGFLGNKFSSFSVNPTSAGRDFAVAQDVKNTIERADRIREKLKKMSPIGESELYNEEVKNQKSALYVIKNGEKIFDINNETAATKEKFGGDYGSSFLLTKRLIENGVSSLQINIGGWDTHSDNFNKHEKQVSSLDVGIDALVESLIEMEKFEQTLILICGEFGRTPTINGDEGRDHFSKVYNAALISGGIRGGQVFGESSEDGYKIKGGVTREDLCNTTMSLIGTPARFEEKNKAPERLLPTGFGIPGFN
ncbi:MAG: DUF1501 domain-containing protein [Lentisphaeraceae bacterium]|nr:DUF1501 domain-containing protein [Lentisphaeraceae bacterium]